MMNQNNTTTKPLNQNKMATVEKVDWFCPKCNSYVSSESVTFEETHQICKTGVILEPLNQNNMKQTAMQELKSDLVLTKETTKNSFLEIENQEIKDACIKVVEMTLNSIITRIDTELLAMEKEQHQETFKQARLAKIFEKDMSPVWESWEQYYNETFKSE